MKVPFGQGRSSIYAWLLIVAVGVLGAPSGHAQEEAQARQDRPTDQSAPVQESRRPIPVQIIEDEEAEARAEQREEDDLAAQQGMNTATQDINDATQEMLKVSRFSTLLVALGTVLLVWTLCETRLATKAALDAVTVTRDIGRAQSQAYLHVEKAELYWGTENGTFPNIILTVQNTGQTPARWFEIQSRFWVDPLTAWGRKDYPDFRACEPRRWSTLGGHGASSRALSLNEEEIKLAGAAFASGNVVLNTVGVVRYETFFGEVFETEFWFTYLGIPPFRTAATPEEIRVDQRESKRKEIPHALKRKSANLLTYKVISGTEAKQ